MSVSPAVFALFHLAVLLGIMVVAALSGRRARTEAWRHRATHYRRLSSEEMLRRLRETRR